MNIVFFVTKKILALSRIVSFNTKTAKWTVKRAKLFNLKIDFLSVVQLSNQYGEREREI